MEDPFSARSAATEREKQLYKKVSLIALFPFEYW